MISPLSCLDWLKWSWYHNEQTQQRSRGSSSNNICPECLSAWLTDRMGHDFIQERERRSNITVRTSSQRYLPSTRNITRHPHEFMTWKSGNIEKLCHGVSWYVKPPLSSLTDPSGQRYWYFMLRYMYMCAVCYNAGVKLLSVMQFKDWLILSRIISFHLTDCICRVGLSQHLGWARASYQS